MLLHQSQYSDVRGLDQSRGTGLTSTCSTSKTAGTTLRRNMHGTGGLTYWANWED